MDNPFDQFDAPQQGPVFGPPPAPPKPEGPPSGYRPDPNIPGGLTYIPGGPADPKRPGGPMDPNNPAKDDKLSVDERTAAFLATRVAGGMRDIAEALKADPSSATPSVLASSVGQLPLIGDWARNVSNPEARQRIEAAQQEVLDAALTLGTGAAYSKEQLAGYQQAYFPQIGDTAQTIADKQARLRRLLEAAKLKAGGAAPQIDAALAALEGQSGDGGGADKTVTDRNGDTWARTDETTETNLRTGEQRLVVDVEGGQLAPELQRQVDQRISQANPGDTAVYGAGDAATFGTLDELGAGADAFIQSLQGKGSLANLYGQNLMANRATIEGVRQKYPGVFFGGQLIGGAAIPIGAGAKTLKELAAVGGTQGAAYGFGSGDGIGDRLGGAATGGVVGASVGAGLGYVAPKLSGILRRDNPDYAAAQPIIEAGQRQGIPIRQPDARPNLRGDFAALETSPSQGPKVQAALQGDRAAMEARVGEVGGQGSPRDPYALGGQIQGAVERHNVQTKAQANALYSRAKGLAGNQVVQPSQTIAEIDSRIAELSASGASANAAEIKVLEGIKSDLQQTGLSIDALQTQRRAMRQRLKDNGIDYSSADASYMGILDTAGKELEQGLAGNPQAQGALRNANAFYAERAAFRKEIAREFAGTPNAPVNPERAAARFISMTGNKGNYDRFSKMLAKLEPDEVADVRATIAETFGRGKNGEFSYGKFVSDLESMNPRALRDLFGSDGVKALADLKVIAAAKRDTAAQFNHSNTGDVISRNGTFKDMVLTALGGGLAGIPGAMAGAVSRSTGERIAAGRMARLLLNPDFTKWLRNAPSNPAAAKPYFSKLTKAAAGDAVFLADIKGLQDALGRAFAQSPERAAAEQESN